MAMPTAARTGFCLTMLCMAAVLAGGAAHSMTSSRGDNEDRVLSVTAAQQLFSDAPDGVDHMVTGPVSSAFRERQREAGCADAVWPNVPLACFPG
ncbi:hypothetical protein [Aquamicrobium defluvii]|uniref:Uncharacterized protein n=1 Tax=Aquamicrobium defluvii TaxID=69279 RepID=A0A011UIF9_9HYPH|nr:hypothetical protein [Aquamicrobium defluvii]EXL05951.1 hypothetical protein BG36_06965 [Aquamicrobium defluvii]EZQ14304.1 hypothetical protein CF98_20130 [Halopseudomonas bauzanensis]TDR30789.1 hypothetical protein DES43_14018 [Aquamicrobium defluvii]